MSLKDFIGKNAVALCSRIGLESGLLFRAQMFLVIELI